MFDGNSSIAQDSGAVVITLQSFAGVSSSGDLINEAHKLTINAPSAANMAIQAGDTFSAQVLLNNGGTTFGTPDGKLATLTIDAISSVRIRGEVEGVLVDASSDQSMEYPIRVAFEANGFKRVEPTACITGELVPPLACTHGVLRRACQQNGCSVVATGSGTTCKDSSGAEVGTISFVPTPEECMTLPEKVAKACKL